MANTWRRATKDDLQAYGKTAPRKHSMDEEEEYGFTSGKKPKRSRTNTKASLMQQAYVDDYDEDGEDGDFDFSWSGGDEEDED